MKKGKLSSISFPFCLYIKICGRHFQRHVPWMEKSSHKLPQDLSDHLILWKLF